MRCLNTWMRSRVGYKHEHKTRPGSLYGLSGDYAAIVVKQLFNFNGMSMSAPVLDMLILFRQTPLPC